MNEFNYLVEKKRMLESLGCKPKYSHLCHNCQPCPFKETDTNLQENVGCNEFEMNHPYEATRVVRKWAEENPTTNNVR